MTLCSHCETPGEAVGEGEASVAGGARIEGVVEKGWEGKVQFNSNVFVPQVDKGSIVLLLSS